MTPGHGGDDAAVDPLPTLPLPSGTSAFMTKARGKFEADGPRCESQPGCQMPAIAEIMWRANGGNKRRGGKQSDTRDGEQRFQSPIVPRVTGQGGVYHPWSCFMLHYLSPSAAGSLAHQWFAGRLRALYPTTVVLPHPGCGVEF